MTQSSTGTHSHVSGVGTPEVGSLGTHEVGCLGNPEVGSLGVHSPDFGTPGGDSLVDIPVVVDSLVVEVGIPPVSPTYISLNLNRIFSLYTCTLMK